MIASLRIPHHLSNELTTINELSNDNLSNINDIYELGEQVGSGTYGDVYKMQCFSSSSSSSSSSSRKPSLLAVKIIKIDSIDDIQSIEQEIKILNHIRHKNIVRYYDSCFRRGRLWITMEFCGGGSLQDVYISIGPLREDEIAFVCREVLAGLMYLHSNNKIHRDVKGANVLLTEDGYIKLADFGVSAEISSTICKRKSFIGTPYWMAPEVAAVERKGGYDQQCDIWAVGITSIELAELQPPLYDLHPMRALFLMSRSNYKPPSLPLTKNPKKRPTANQLSRHRFVYRQDIEDYIGLKLYARCKQYSSANKTRESDIDNDTVSFQIAENNCLVETLGSHLACEPFPDFIAETFDTRSNANSSDERSTDHSETCTIRVNCRNVTNNWLRHRVQGLFPHHNPDKILKRCENKLPTGCLNHLSDSEVDHIITVIVREMEESNQQNDVFNTLQNSTNMQHRDSQGWTTEISNNLNGQGFKNKFDKSTSSGPMPGIPPVPKILMGACFTKIFNNCPYRVNSAVNWISPQASENLIFIGCDEGIYTLDLIELHESCLRKVFNKKTTWLYVRDNVLWSLSGTNATYIYKHELTNSSHIGSAIGLRKRRASLSDLATKKSKSRISSGLDKVFHSRFTKLSNSRGTQLCTVAQCDFSGFLFLVSASFNKLCLRQYYEPMRQFLLLKIFSIEFSTCPSIFRLLLLKEYTYPLLCLAVSNKSQTPSGLVLADLNKEDNIVDSNALNNPNNLQSIQLVQLQDEKKLLIAHRECLYIACFDDKKECNIRLIFLLFRLPDPLTKIIALPDSVLTFYCHGMIGKNLKDGQITQDISDVTKVFTVINDQGLVIMKSQPVEQKDSHSSCDLLILMGHKNSL
ncbi:hypothetical protein GJ496_002503 [Pomphorhynchus laevis]|nr:hypothetical protein GJ496_002503 [Pomphorhynchus laevis]